MYTPILQQHCAQFEEALPRYMPTTGGLQTTVAEAMAYACAGGGKRIRPVLLMECCRLCGGDSTAAIPFAAANAFTSSSVRPAQPHALTRIAAPFPQLLYGWGSWAQSHRQNDPPYPTCG